MLKGILLDLDDTLYDYKGLEKRARQSVEDYAEKVLQLDRNRFCEAFREGREAVKQQLPYVAAGHNRLLYYQKALEIMNYRVKSSALELEEVYWNYMLEHMKLNKGVIELLEFAKKKGWKIGICTDLTAQIQLRKIRKLDLEQWIDCLVTSEEVGVEKPNIKIFQICLSKMGLESKEVLYIGDSYYRDVEGALNAGMKVVWYISDLKGVSPEKCKCTDNFIKLIEELKDGLI